MCADVTQIYYAVDALLEPVSREPLSEPVVVGVVGLSNIDLRSRSAEFGRFLIGRPGFRGAGCGREAAYLLCDYAFNSLGLHRLWAEVVAGNVRARSLYASIGFRDEALLRGHVRKAGGLVDVARIVLPGAEFRKRDVSLRASLGLEPRGGAGARCRSASS